MGSVVDFKNRPKKLTPYDEFEQSYIKHHKVISALTNSIIAELKDLVDIEGSHPYDTFMLRESLMSLVMRQEETYHPLQEFTDEFVVTFGEAPKED
jgi:hypothetical protein